MVRAVVGRRRRRFVGRVVVALMWGVFAVVLSVTTASAQEAMVESVSGRPALVTTLDGAPRWTPLPARPREALAAPSLPNRWEKYPVETVVVDGAAFLVAVGTRSFVAGASVFLLGAPIVHLVHANYGSALGSLAMRAVPLALIYDASTCKERYTPVDDGVNYDDGTLSCLDNFALGFLSVLALPFVSALDAGLLAKKKIRVNEQAWSFAPYCAPRRRAGGLWMSARF